MYWFCRGYPAKRALPPCLRMADRALLAGYPRCVSSASVTAVPYAVLCHIGLCYKGT